MPTASLLVIGDEILTGRTQDRNTAFIAEALATLGIDLVEARIVGDREEAIVDSLNALRARTDYVFTTGGIGPTHDDITAGCVAKAFDVPLKLDPRAVELMKARYPELELNEARLRMARVPEGAELIPNAVSGAPGFIIGNVHVLAGVPQICQAMMQALLPHLAGGVPMQSVTLDMQGWREGDYASRLAAIAADWPDVSIGSYPHLDGGKVTNSVVLRAKDKNSLAGATRAVKAMLASLSE